MRRLILSRRAADLSREARYCCLRSPRFSQRSMRAVVLARIAGRRSGGQVGQEGTEGKCGVEGNFESRISNPESISGRGFEAKEFLTAEAAEKAGEFIENLRSGIF